MNFVLKSRVMWNQAVLSRCFSFNNAAFHCSSSMLKSCHPLSKSYGMSMSEFGIRQHNYTFDSVK